MSYAIICTATKGSCLDIETLAMVDRLKVKNKWWTTDSLRIIKFFDSKQEAESICDKLKFNNPKVVPYAYALELIRAQNKTVKSNYDYFDRINLDNTDYEQGWDSHKH